MIHEDLMMKIDLTLKSDAQGTKLYWALRAVLQSHRPVLNALPVETCFDCQNLWPCTTYDIIKKELA